MGHRSQTHCKSGHEFTPDNTYWTLKRPYNGRRGGLYRQCRACKLADMKFFDTYKRTSPKSRRLECR